MGWDKREFECDVGLGLKMQLYQHPAFLRNLISGRSTVPFTVNQRQELERQTIIYKYMMASMPVPPQLLIPLSKHATGGGGRGGDSEPWRCRRTDGKKWRCSRDVTPDHKYCERHSHKGKPSARSRKPVESFVSMRPPSSNAIDFSSSMVLSNPRYTDERFRPRNHTIEQGLNTTTTTAFIDAWSLADAKTSESPSSSNSTLPLTLSVSSIDDHHCDTGMRSMTMTSASSQPLNWMTSGISSPCGGQLAEALCLVIGGGTTSYDHMTNNFEDFMSSSIPYTRNSTTHSGNKDTSDQIFRLH